MLQKLRNTKGFTLIELMIVVAIIGILAAIAIPNFLTYQKKSKTAEAKTCIGGIKTSQLSYQTERDVYMTCSVLPANPPTASKIAWPAAGGGGGFDTIGWRPAGDVYYAYEALPAADALGNSQVCITGISDIDGDLAIGAFGFSTDAGTATTTNTCASAVSETSQLQDLNPGVF